MPIVDVYEQEVLSTFEKGSLKSVATKGELLKFMAAARVFTVKGDCVNFRLSSIDLNDIEINAFE